ncbi:Xaa-Pro aminopeptidase [Chitiniphilus shinanonensis]|uniref:Xaa-Pro aminopeptidase n=1 Tax=Chitiniphilus shinanonensis TaxID=553088 RepID=A0ABQ6BXG3_9NEIS|nr:Xaa-Pro aminopeptidase [Chitiniphilus shinanonensis]GLS06102.1 Xaa-Pro aminopeptidase [Chitiniphilus shinanonensis]
MQPYSTRRDRLAARLAPGVVVVPTAPEVARNADTGYPYRFDSGFYYLTGFPEPEAVLVMLIGEDGEQRSLLFCRDKNLEREIWDGYRFGPAAAAERFGFAEAHPYEALDEEIVKLLANQPRIHTAFGADAAWDQRVAGWLNAVRAQGRAGLAAPREIVDVRGNIDEMRLFKDEHELALMREAGRINAGAHIRAMRNARPGMPEYAVEAELLHEYYRHGSRFPAYSSIVASGPNACVLHYVENDRVMQDGDLLLIDAGCEYQGYASDITRTFPVNGRFSGPQKAVYQVVLDAHRAAMAHARPGASWNAMHEAAVEVLAQGLIDLKLLSGSLDAVLEQESYRQFYMHRTGHWLGLDVHDAGAYKLDGAWRPLQPGMVFTVEPGLYIRPADNVPAEFEHIGVRIEDDVAITADGHEVLTDACPRTVAQIEALMAERQA